MEEMEREMEMEMELEQAAGCELVLSVSHQFNLFYGTENP